ncbi:MAG: ferrous iron transport protein B [Bacilli bacterium]|nr:ferrous iron transport protein B [Bacilli bacterium]
MTLKELMIGEEAIITKVGGSGSLRQHFLDMGLIPGVTIKLVKFAPLGDPMQVLIHGYELTIRLDDAKEIEISKEFENKKEEDETIDSTLKVHHPGLGEDGIYHNKEDENPLPKGDKLSFALAGNQNCGKTTLFNQLTGSNQHVGNFPGVTVDEKSGAIRGFNDTIVTDLPGVYSLSPYSPEELISREFILKAKPKCIINIIDATNIERNLYLTLQLMELGIPVVLALNMMDEVHNNGGTIRINEMEELLGIPVVPISAAKNEGIDELIKHAIHIAKYQEKPLRDDFCKPNDEGGAVHRCIHAVMSLIEDHAIKANLPIRFAATKIIEGDKIVLNSLNLNQNEIEMIEHIVLQMEEERGLDRQAAISDMRYRFILSLCHKTVVKPKESIEHKRSIKIDKVLTGKFTAIPAFILIMALIFFLSFNLIGGNLQALMELGMDKLGEATKAYLTSLDVNKVVQSLLVDGVFKGVGTVITFLPIIVTLFLFLSLLEDSGYMARIAFVMDKLLRKIGLSGRSIVPLLIGFGCSVPAIMANRTLPSERDRKMTIMLIPFMSCTAKIPIYAFFSSAFFKPQYSWLVMTSLYIIGIIISILVALLSKSTFFKGKAVPFVMELPNYRIPGMKNVVRLLWDKIKDFLKRAFTIIFLASIVIWFLQSFDMHFTFITDEALRNTSILARISSTIAPIFKLHGFADWKIVTSLFAGFMAKESVVSTLTLLLGGESIANVLSPLAAYSLLVFCLLYTPCVAAIASVKKELGRLWAVGIVVGQCLIAWVVSLIVALIGGIF